jgi:hypothetical protein
MIFAGMLGAPRGGGGHHPRPHPRPVRPFHRRGGGGASYAWPGYYLPEYPVTYACAVYPAPPPACAGRLVWQDANTVCCIP